MKLYKDMESFFSIRGTKYKGVFFILGLNIQNENFLVGIKRENDIVQIGSFTEGLKQNEKQSLIQAIMSNQKKMKENTVFVKPGICIELSFQSINNDQLINPYFKSFQLELTWEQCTWDRLVLDNAFVQYEVKITHPDKIIWEKPFISKERFVAYLIQISPFILPFLEKRILTTIRYPHGIPGESFYQKNCPDYAPSFIRTKEKDGINYIVCNDLSTLLWLGNQLAIEYHVPFQTIETDRPLEIVFDLDPPNSSSFSQAIKAAKEMKKIFDNFDIISYPKLSGSKGLQIHIPINRGSLSYDDTRIFTSFIANYLVEKFPNDFTIERMKKNRGGRLYIDYIQHAEGKTIICPYSTRGKEQATVAAPLYWEEVNEKLKVEKYNVPFVLDRLSNKNCPMSDFFAQENTSLLNIISTLKKKITG
ncbi:DNA ligase D [Bacillus sp. FJAT-29937]|uniref:DNA ligase D n=1 Tax=Bacillus sp. FJAT-29937 TaxID=1720553 RepID=UPI0008303E7E|nr:DNA ligase D [Bacillus sp. FJAT-29937]